MERLRHDGTKDDGTKDGDAQMDARFEQKKARLNAKASGVKT